MAAVVEDPPDLATIRATARRLLAGNAKPIGPDELDTLGLTLRGHLQLLVPEIEKLAGKLPKYDIPAACAMAGVHEASMRIRLGPGDNSPVRMSVAMRLARSVNALCDHYEALADPLLTPTVEADMPGQPLPPSWPLAVPAPVGGCDVCEALARQRDRARALGDHSKVTDCSVEIRRHPHPTPTR